MTVRYAEPKPFAAFIARARKANGLHCTSGETVMIGILESIIDRMADVLERLGNEIDAVSREVFPQQGVQCHQEDPRPAIADRADRPQGDFLTATRESLVTISRLVAYHAALETPGRKPPKETRQRIKLLQRDAVFLSDHAQFLSARSISCWMRRWG